jgi:hypothetical protein
MKKQVKKNQGEKTSKLSFNRETIRHLTDAEQKAVVGGRECEGTRSCPGTRTCVVSW